MRRYFFCNIGWMEHYKGQPQKDPITGGGAYVKEKGTGFEVCNFAGHQGRVYGYVRSSRGGQIKIERLGAELGDKSVKNVTVIWTATRPGFGRVVVGWYRNAEVHRHYVTFPDTPPCHKKNSIDIYWIEARKADAKLLPIDERTFEMPRGKGYMGQSNVWYAEEAPWTFLKKIEQLLSGKKPQPAPRSHKTNPERNAEVERAAVKKTTEYYEKHGYKIEGVEKENRGWDLEATLKNENPLLIEVKGLSGKGLVVELTPNEHSALKEHEKDGYRVCVVNMALTNPQLFVCRYSEEKNKWIVEDKDGVDIKIDPRKGASFKIKPQ